MHIFQFLASPTTLLLPTKVVTKTTRTQASTVPIVLVEYTPLDDFFGYTLSTTCTHESRHDSSAVDVLPPYVEGMPPAYSLRPYEPVALTKYLFKFGFFFPPFWILGACILWSPLRASHSNVEAAWMGDKRESERQRVTEMRRAEVRWALRCLWALLILALLAAIAGIATWVIIRS